jgi:hypothetical protein
MLRLDIPLVSCERMGGKAGLIDATALAREILSVIFTR